MGGILWGRQPSYVSVCVCVCARACLCVRVRACLYYFDIGVYVWQDNDFDYFAQLRRDSNGRVLCGYYKQ